MKTEQKTRFVGGILFFLSFLFASNPGSAQVCPFTVNLTSITAATCNGNNGSIRILAPTGGQSPYTYSWNTVPARTTQNLLSVAPGTYTLKVTDKRGCVVTRVWTIPNTPDTEVPLILCSPTPITVATEPGLCGAFINFQDNVPIDYRMNTAGGATGQATQRGPFAGGDAPARDVLKPIIADNCNVVSISGVRLDGQPLSAMYPLGNTAILWTAMDAAGNQATCTQIYTIVDNESPVLTGVPANIVLDAAAQSCGRTVTWTAPVASDNCSAVLTSNRASGSFFNIGTQTVTYTASDLAGNVTSRSFTVTIRDAEKPVILTCAPDMTVALGADCQARPVLPLPVASDNCPSSPLTFSNDAPAVFPSGTTVVTWTVRDSSGNSATCQQRVTVADQTAPVPVLATLADVTGVCTASVTPPTATDCSGTITATTADATTYTTPGTHIVHWTYTDAAGNSFVQLQNVILRDDELPIIQCPADITVMANAACGRILNPGTATATDNCTVTVSGVRNDGRALGDCYPVGTTTITWTAVDGAGNSATCQQKVIVNSISIGGTIYNDVDAGTINGTPISNADGQLFVNLVNTATNTVVSSKALTNGTYSFSSADGMDANVTSYAVVVATNATATTAGLPNAQEWVNTAEGAPASSGDGNADGAFVFGSVVADGQVVDFGIEARPATAALLEAPIQVNPGGTTEVTIDPLLFSATDIRDLNGSGEVRFLHIISFPTRATSVSFGAASATPGAAPEAVTYTAASFPAGGVYVATDLSGRPLPAIAADPVNGAVNVDFNYKAVDQAGVESNQAGIARKPLTELWIAGTVYNDVDAMNDGSINGTPIATSNGQPLFVNLVNASNGAIVASATVADDGKYRFTSHDGLCTEVPTYCVVLATSATNNSSSLPNPASWWNTGVGSSNCATGWPFANNGAYNFGGRVTNGLIVDFGIEARPVPTPLTVAAAKQNPGSTNDVSIAGTIFSATDDDDVAGGEVRFLHVLSFPTNTTSLFFAKAAHSIHGEMAARHYTAATFPASGVYLEANNNGNAVEAISVDPVDGAVNVDFVYTAIDQADAESNTSGIARQPLTDFVVSGNVYDDANGCTDGLINGSLISNAGGPLFVNLVRGNVLIASKMVTNGAFSFGTADGLSATVPNYKLVLAKSVNGTVAALPDATNWVNTGEGISGSSGDGSVDGSYTFGGTLTSGQAIDFGIEARPVPATLNVAPSQVNPGGTATVAIASTLFAATDASDLNNAGQVRYIWISSFPTNATTVNFAGAATTPGGASSAVSYTAATFPANGVYLTTNSAGNPTTAITVDPVDGAVNVDVTYKAVDQAQVLSNNSGIARLPLTCPAPTITCPAAIVTSNSANKCGANLSVTAPAAASQCGITSVEGVRNDGQPVSAMYPIGTTTITWTATAGNGATVSCTQTVKVNDTQLPTLACNAAIVVNASAAACNAQVAVMAPVATDNCGVTVAGMRSDALALSAAYPVGTTTITWTATDASGNTASCMQTVTVKDAAAPTLTVPANITACDNGSGNNKTLVASATDNCSTVALTWTLSGATTGSGTGNTVARSFSIGVTTITWTAKDGANNTVGGTTTVTIDAIPTATITLSTRDSLCNNTVLTGAGGTGFQWMNGGNIVGTSQTLSLPLAHCTGSSQFAPTSAASNFNVFVRNAVTASAGDTHGPVAMGGNLLLSGNTVFVMNSRGSYPSGTMNGANNYGMVIGGAVQFTSGNQSTVNQGYLRIGNTAGAQIWYTDNNNASTNLKLTAAGAGFNGNPSLMLQRTQPGGTATQAHGIDFAAAFTAFSAYSAKISSWSTAAEAVVNRITIAAGSNPHIVLADNKINYINLTAAQLNALNNQGSIIFDNTPAANRTLVFNVTMTGDFSWTPANFGGLSEPNGAHILWNFTGNGKLTIDGSNAVYGTVFAPSNDIVKNNGNNLNGQVIGLSLKVGPGEIHYYPFASGLGYSTCNNQFQLFVTSANGCKSAASETYTYVAPQNSERFTILGLDAVTLDNNYVQTGNVGVNNAGGTATISGTSAISGAGAYLKAPSMTVAASASVPNRSTSTAGYVLPAMQYYTGTYAGTPLTVAANTTATYSGNYTTVYVSKGASATFSGSTFQSVTIEEGASASFTAATVNMQNLTVGNGNNPGIASVNFAHNSNIRISGQLLVGMSSEVNDLNRRVTFFMGTDAATDKVSVKGGGAVVNGVFYAPTGNINVGTNIGVPVTTAATATNCTQNNGCIYTTYRGYTQNSDGTYTLSFTIMNKCTNAVSYMAFEVPTVNGQSGVASWTRNNTGQSYNAENPCNNPFKGFKLETIGEGIKQNQTETITYRIKAEQFNAMSSFRVAVKYATNVATATFSREGCGSVIRPTVCTPTYMTGLFVGKQVIGDKCVYWNGLNCGSSSEARTAPQYVRNEQQAADAFRMITSEEVVAAKINPTVEAFPNPSSGSFRLQLTGIGAGVVQVQVLNASGAVVAARQLTYGGKGESLPFQLGNVPAGLYTVRVTGADGALSTRVMIAR